MSVCSRGGMEMLVEMQFAVGDFGGDLGGDLSGDLVGYLGGYLEENWCFFGLSCCASGCSAVTEQNRLTWDRAGATRQRLHETLDSEI